jgi:hypothetical protein
MTNESALTPEVNNGMPEGTDAGTGTESAS